MYLTKKQTADLVAFIDMFMPKEHSAYDYWAHVWVASIKLKFPKDVDKANELYREFCETTYQETELWADCGALDMHLTTEYNPEDQLVYSAYLYPTYIDDQGRRQTDTKVCLGTADDFFRHVYEAENWWLVE